MVTFENKKTPVKLYEHTIYNLGGKNLDMALLDRVCDRFIEENKDDGADPRKTKKSCLRLIDAVEKARIALSCDDEATLDVDNVVGD